MSDFATGYQPKSSGAVKSRKKVAAKAGTYAIPKSPGVGAILGLKKLPLGRLGLALRVEAGLPVSTVDHLAIRVAPGDSSFASRLVATATLARRRQEAKLSPKKARLSMEESARALRVARIFDRALSVWHEEDAARDFLNRPHMLLEDRTPMDVAIKTEAGAREVEDILGRLQYGTAL